jgi:uncharacterized coiled-coil protein SlyX
MRACIPNSLAGLFLASAVAAGHAQTSASLPPAAAVQGPSVLEQKIESISAALVATQQQLEQSQHQIQELQQELRQLREQVAAGSAVPAHPATAEASIPFPQPSIATSSSAPPAATASTEERIETLEAALKLHDQTKVESNSKYPVRLTGLILFNGFLNKGLADNIDLPAVALHQTSTSGNGSLGATLRQTILGVEGNGPHFLGARTSADVNFDFFSGISYTSYGTSAGVVRMRTAGINFDWSNDSLQVGMEAPLISPLSPTSFATVAEPSLAGAGNLWAWAPQLRYAHRFTLQDENHLQFEFGLWDSPAAGYNSNQLFRSASPAELAEQPAYETRISYGSPDQRGLEIGASGYYSRQAYPGYQGYNGTENLDSWAGTSDWKLPLSHRFEVSGEGYRGRSIGGLGGGVYKDAVTGTSPISGAPALSGLNAIGGWSQIKTRFGQSTETNLSIGMDDGFASDFHTVVPLATATVAQLRARNKMVVGDLIYRPRTYIILSPEYRRIWTWPITGAPATLDIFTLSFGYEF